MDTPFPSLLYNRKQKYFIQFLGLECHSENLLVTLQKRDTEKKSMSLDNYFLQMGNACNKVSHLVYYLLYSKHFSRQTFKF